MNTKGKAIMRAITPKTTEKDRNHCGLVIKQHYNK